MSDITIQTTASDQLAGGQKPPSADAEQKSRSGFSGSQVFPLSGKQGVEVTPGTAGPIAPAPNSREAATVAGMYVSAPLAVSVRPVDRRTLEGSTPGDFRKQASPAVLPNQRGPREGMGQTKISSRTPEPSAPVSFIGNNDNGN